MSSNFDDAIYFNADGSDENDKHIPPLDGEHSNASYACQLMDDEKYFNADGSEENDEVRRHEIPPFESIESLRSKTEFQSSESIILFYISKLWGVNSNDLVVSKELLEIRSRIFNLLYLRMLGSDKTRKGLIFSLRLNNTKYLMVSPGQP